ncbi:MAG: glycoside hydrolase family 2 TIM barrel-domain containing protein [Anaerolineae bacterium]
MTSSASHRELFELDTEAKWEYMRRYYEAACEFYGYRDQVLDEDEIRQAVRAFKEKPAPKYRRSIPLNTWKYRHDFEDQGLEAGFFARDLDDSDWERVNSPHSTRDVPEKPLRYGVSRYPFMVESGKDLWYGITDNWYRTSLGPEAPGPDQVAYLHFDSNNLISDIWLNENPVMIDHWGLFPFEMDVTEEMQDTPDGRIHIALRVRNIVTNRPWLFYNGFQISYYNPPYNSGALKEDWYDQPWTGIAGEARLDILHRTHLQSAHVFTQALVEGRAEICCHIEFRNEAWRRFRGRVRVEISPWLPVEGDVVQRAEVEVDLLPMEPATMDVRLTLEDPALWSPEHPNLYLAHIVLENEHGEPVDDLYETLGVRTICIVGGNYYLNNQKTYVRGTHDVCHYWRESEICPSDEAIVRDILLHKKMGANCSRWPSDLRIHYKRIAEYCDQLGYMLAWAGYFEVWLCHPEMEMLATRDVKAMVRSLRNCPSIIIWEMGDEPLLTIKHYRRFQWFKQVYELVKAEDVSRPILPAGHFSGDLLYIYEAIKRETGADPAEIRKRIRREYPVYNLELAYWDIHDTFMKLPLKPFRQYIDRVKEAFGGERLSILTEFGFDALPDPAKVSDVYGGFHWGANPLWHRDRKIDDICFYGRELAQDDWRETQAAQAVELCSAIVYLRENPEFFCWLLLHDHVRHLDVHAGCDR